MGNPKTPSRLEVALGHAPPPHVSPPKESAEDAARRLGLIQCQQCKANGKPMFFANTIDLNAHVAAWHVQTGRI